MKTATERGNMTVEVRQGQTIDDVIDNVVDALTRDADTESFVVSDHDRYNRRSALRHIGSTITFVDADGKSGLFLCLLSKALNNRSLTYTRSIAVSRDDGIDVDVTVILTYKSLGATLVMSVDAASNP